MIAPYGSWSSPISAESLTESAVGIDEVTFDGDDLYWLQSDPADGGRVSLWRSPGGSREEINEVTPAPFNVRSRVHEYGGGAYAVADGVVVFSHFADNRLYRLDASRAGATPEPITADGLLRYAAIRLDIERDLIIAVREDHRPAGDGEEPVNTVVGRRLSDRPEVADRVLCSGADFYAAPELSADGRLAWVEWRHPNMPWDSTQLMVGELPGNPTGSIDLEPRDAGPIDGRLVAGGDGESVAAPCWLGTELIFISDRTDWWNIYRTDGDRVVALCPMEAEFTRPGWVLGNRPYALLDSERLVCSFNIGNRYRVGVLQLATGQLDDIDSDAVLVGGVATDGSRVATKLGYPDRPTELVISPTDGGVPTVIRRSGERTWPGQIISRATEVSWDSDLGPVYGWFYPPRNDGFRAPGGEQPPMITISHGGPTAGSAPVFDPEILFWTSRGVAVLDVNYGGSTGYGRRYRERLRRAWGIVDVADCAAGAIAMAEQGRADGSRLAIQGGSAGGYTTLRALTATSVFTAGISRYGIGDLTALARDTHKFESRYLDSLVGSYPEEAAVFADRSPINHLDQLDAPILLLQGTEDKVVPPNQAESFAEAARSAGLTAELIMFEGEGHGFRKAENITAGINASLSFLGRVYGFTPAQR
jgi:dipeptidyl aminopeptidase/acylaminoacyl peptidase